MAQAAVKRVNEIRQSSNLPFSAIARSVGLSESTLRRWRRKEKQQKPVLTVPGPKKPLPLDMEALMAGMSTLKPMPHRIAGAPDLWQAHRDRISRRDFYSELTRYSVRMLNLEKQGYYRYLWLKVGAIWAMDDMDFGEDEQERPLRTHNVMDLGSRNMFTPLCGSSLPAEKVAENLDGLFAEKGAPVFVKSDNGTNLLRADDVSKVLSKWCVMPLLSPPYYPQYNGVIERGQTDARREIGKLLPEKALRSADRFPECVIIGTDKRNHILRDVLGGQHACQVFSNRNGEMKTSIQERGEIYDWLKEKQESILSLTGSDPDDGWAVNAAWRSAAEEWLLQNKVIEIVPGTGKCQPIYSN